MSKSSISAIDCKTLKQYSRVGCSQQRRRHSIAEALSAALQAPLPAVHGCPRPALEIRKFHQSLQLAPSSTVHYFTVGGVKLSFHGMAYDHNVFHIFHLLKTDSDGLQSLIRPECALKIDPLHAQQHTLCTSTAPPKAWPPSQRQTAIAGFMTDTPQKTRDTLPDTGLFACSESQQRSAQSNVALSSAGAYPWKLPNWSEPGRRPLWEGTPQQSLLCS